MYSTDIILSNIEKLLTEKNIPKMKFYKDIGISAGSFGDWRSGKSNPSRKTLIKLANYFNCSIEDLKTISDDNIFIKNNNKSIDTRQQKLLNLFNMLDDNFKEKAINNLIDLCLEFSNEQSKKVNENKAYLAALDAGVTEIPEDLANLIEKKVNIDETPRIPDLNNL